MKKNVPVYAIHDFQAFSGEGGFYANYLPQHIAQHHMISVPHKHDFYLVVLFTAGSGKHEVDFKTYTIKPGALFILKPGQMHNWTLSKDIDGFVFFHTREFYDEGFTTERLLDYPFYSSFRNPPLIMLKGNVLKEIREAMSAMVNEYRGHAHLKFRKIHALVNLAYIEMTRLYKPAEQIDNATYLLRVQKFEELLDKNFKVWKSAKDYASALSITEKHLNRIVKESLNKTTTELIAERIILEAKRMLIQSKFNAVEIGTELGFADKSYFSRFFKKNTGETAMSFQTKYREK